MIENNENELKWEKKVMNKKGGDIDIVNFNTKDELLDNEIQQNHIKINL